MFNSREILAILLSAVLLPPEDVLGVPTFNGGREKRAMQQAIAEEGRYFEGDIIMQPHKKMQDDERDLKSLVADPELLWPDKTLYYKLSDEFTESDKRWIRSALADLQTSTCVRFKESSDSGAYMFVRNVKGCAAPVGYHGVATEMYLATPGCYVWGTIQHEFLHALGFWHEHTRPDRNDYVTIMWNKIIPGNEANFFSRSSEEVQYEGLPYDYGSVMHYRAAAFSVDGYPTIVTRDKTATIGQRIRYSKLDVAKLNRLYRCGPPYYTGDDIASPVRETSDVGGSTAYDG